MQRASCICSSAFHRIPQKNLPPKLFNPFPLCCLMVFIHSFIGFYIVSSTVYWNPSRWFNASSKLLIGIVQQVEVWLNPIIRSRLNQTQFNETECNSSWTIQLNQMNRMNKWLQEPRKANETDRNKPNSRDGMLFNPNQTSSITNSIPK